MRVISTGVVFRNATGLLVRTVQAAFVSLAALCFSIIAIIPLAILFSVLVNAFFPAAGAPAMFDPEGEIDTGFGASLVEIQFAIAFLVMPLLTFVSLLTRDAAAFMRRNITFVALLLTSLGAWLALWVLYNQAGLLDFPARMREALGGLLFSLTACMLHWAALRFFLWASGLKHL